MTEDIVISVDREKDKVIIENGQEYDAYTTIGHRMRGDFYLKLEFAKLHEKTFGDLSKWSLEPRELAINSAVIKKNGYDITHIIVEKFQTNSNYELIWECISDKPGMSLIIK